MIPMIIFILAFCLLLGFPMLMPMTVSAIAIIYYYIPNFDLMLISQQYINGVSMFVFIAIPMFIFAADIMSSGKTANRLVDLVKVFFGHVYGGLAITVAGTSTLFGAISGSSQATVVAIGQPMRVKMIENGYSEEDTNSLIISSATMASIIPPSIGMIMYGVLTGTSVGEMFIAGIFPGLLLFSMIALYSYFSAKKKGVPRVAKSTIKEKVRVFKNSLLSLGFPLIIIVGIYSGIFSPTEAAAVAVLYAIICEVIIYKSIKPKDLISIALSTGAVTATVFILIGAGQAFSWIITYIRLPQSLTGAILGADPSSIKVLVTVTIFFFISGMFVDQLVCQIILVPIFFPVAMAAGIDPVHLGILVVIQTMLGGISPPFGASIFTACAAFDQPYIKVVKGLPIYILIFLVFSILIIFVPQISTFYRIFI